MYRQTERTSTVFNICLSVYLSIDLSIYIYIYIYRYIDILKVKCAILCYFIILMFHPYDKILAEFCCHPCWCIHTLKQSTLWGPRPPSLTLRWQSGFSYRISLHHMTASLRPIVPVWWSRRHIPSLWMIHTFTYHFKLVLYEWSKIAFVFSK